MRVFFLIFILTFSVYSSYSQIRKGTFEASGTLAYADGYQYKHYNIFPEISYWFNDKYSVGISTGLSKIKPKVGPESGSWIKNGENFSVFATRNIKIGYGNYFALTSYGSVGKVTAYHKAGVKLSLLLFLTRNVALQFQVFQFEYQSYISEKDTRLSMSIFHSNPISLNFFINTSKDSIRNTQKDFTDKKLLSGTISFSNPTYEGVSFSVIPSIQTFVSRNVSVGIMAGMYKKVTALQQNTGIEIAPIVRLYHWANTRTGLFAETSFLFGFSKQADNHNNVFYQTRYGPVLKAGLVRFLTDRLLIEANISILKGVFSSNFNEQFWFLNTSSSFYIGADFTQVNLGMGILLGK